MNAIAYSWSARPSERRFYLWMSLLIAVTVVAGFGRREATGTVSWADLPFQVAMHGLLFATWIALFVVQCALVDRGSAALHRKLGAFGAGIAALMVPLAVIVSMMCVRRGAVPQFFPPNVFLVLNTLDAVAFGGLLAAGIALRRKPDWHRRLMLCGTIKIMSPALPRLLSLGALGIPVPISLTGLTLAYMVAGMAFDLVAYKRIHRAWWIGTGVVVAEVLMVGPIAFSPPVRALATRLLSH